MIETILHASPKTHRLVFRQTLGSDFLRPNLSYRILYFISWTSSKTEKHKFLHFCVTKLIFCDTAWPFPFTDILIFPYFFTILKKNYLEFFPSWLFWRLLHPSLEMVRWILPWFSVPSAKCKQAGWEIGDSLRNQLRITELYPSVS